ncbi:MAG: gamma-glutamyltransferase family protein [Sterolibacteriaceae bacterium]|nr:gamma-glutamyltransferase family protein [Sterolibacteriaceae bacterium]
MAVAPHSLAAQSALAVLREGGNALEAMIACAATIAVAYPHMNSIGGDSFWLVSVPGQAPRAIDACGAAAAAASPEWYAEREVKTELPARGPLAALTVAGTISGWDLALAHARELGGKLPLSRLLADAIDYAIRGVPVSASLHRAITAKHDELAHQPGFAEVFLPGGRAPTVGDRLIQPRLAAALHHLSDVGLDAFYRGDLAHSIAADLERLGSPLALNDLIVHRARWRAPLMLAHRRGTVYNLPPPTQGLVSLLILGQLDALGIDGLAHDDARFVHLAVEATKQAFAIKDRYLTDPVYMAVEAQGFLDRAAISAMVERISPDQAAPWPPLPGSGDTVWMGVIDAAGRAVSCIQSVYHEFGSGIVLGDSGINWQNRGVSFSLEPNALNRLMPGRKPFHTLNPALAQLHDGRTVIYGTMGGDGQPQTQAAIFSRYVNFGLDPQAAIDAPRWRLGRAWGQDTDTLKLESRFSAATVDRLHDLGHQVELLGDYDESMGHAGMVVRHANGTLEGGADPRSNGCVAAF